MAIIHQEGLEERARNLDAKGLNGMELVLVTLPSPTEARLEVHFFNNRELANIINVRDFLISGGHRVLGGRATGEVQVTAIAHPSPNILHLTVTPIGDYSTYTLSLNFQNIDPLFSELRFKFRPGCFSTECAPKQTFKPAPQDPAIDYLAKDYDSFRHTMIAAMMQRVPGWRPTSEADLDQVLLELFSVAADELSDYQDRVMNEAYLPTARKRVSWARHARLMDYHIHQGNQASTWLALLLKPGQSLTLPKPNPTPGLDDIPLIVWAGNKDINATSAVLFMTRDRAEFDPLFNQMGLYTWGNAIPALAAGSTMADLQLLEKDSNNQLVPIVNQADAIKLQNSIRSGKVKYLLIQERLNPLTGQAVGRNPNKRQLLKLLPGELGATVKQDPLTESWFVRVQWEEQDKLQFNYCFTVDCQNVKRENVSLFHGNLIEVYHGRPRNIEFKEPGTLLRANQYYYQRTKRWGTLCQLPPETLAYKATPVGGEVPPQSTLEVEVIVDGVSDRHEEAIDLIHSDDSAEAGDRFIVETDELGQSIIRFGNGVNGRELPDEATVRCKYQVGLGLEGNIGADTLIYFDRVFEDAIASVWNPFDVTNGKAPEPVAEIIRRVPEAYRFRQLRAVTLQDYVKRAEELPEVSKAAARYAWTGSWRTVQIAIDPVGKTVLDEPLRQKLARHLDAVRLIGEDLEIRPPRFVPLEIHVILCIHPEYWREDIKFLLNEEFSDGFTSDGRMAFFHPDRWTFGQELPASQIIGRLQAIQGVEHVISVTLKRWNEATPGTDKIANLRPNEIIQVRSDRDHMEKGFIDFDVQGGRQ
jgi:Baseplate J-like protein